ncbi:unnamed protein product [Prunus armeniaca]|uniref:Uncharacterized protein n=1 Tax=Prunus armeniaca TaxID=36596 RepID=A0A6J5W7E6_PRUAR|nr:unnamed protein product [Prunus armeniaca]
MHMYQPTGKRRVGDMKFDVGSGGQVLDLNTTVKYGILGGRDGLICGGDVDVVAEKLDMKKMIEELEAIEMG